jgi:hypothetical protein
MDSIQELSGNYNLNTVLISWYLFVVTDLFRQVGQRIRARNSNGEWADAIIVSIDESKYAIKWHETNTQEEVAPDAINNGRYLRIDSKL